MSENIGKVECSDCATLLVCSTRGRERWFCPSCATPATPLERLRAANRALRELEETNQLLEGVKVRLETQLAVSMPDERQRTDTERLMAFVGAVMEEHRHDGEPGDVDGGVLQDMAVAHGLLVEVTVTEPCDPEFCVCAETVNFPTTCYRNSDLMKRCVRVALLPAMDATTDE